MKTSTWIILAIVAYIAYVNRAKLAALLSPATTTSTAQMGVLQTVEDRLGALELPHPKPAPLRVTRVM